MKSIKISLLEFRMEKMQILSMIGELINSGKEVQEILRGINWIW